MMLIQTFKRHKMLAITTEFDVLAVTEWRVL